MTVITMTIMVKTILSTNKTTGSTNSMNDDQSMVLRVKILRKIVTKKRKSVVLQLIDNKC